MGKQRNTTKKRARLEQKGWKVGTAKEFLNLTDEQAAYIEVKLALSDCVKQHRARKKLTQVQLAKLLCSSQSRVAKIEAGDPSVSLDLMVRSAIALGATRKDIANVIGGK